MLLRWTEVNEIGEEIVRNNYPVTVENAHTYARRNHRICHGRGYLPFDSGWQDGVEFSEELGRKVYVRKPINPRVYTCPCVDRHIERFGI